MFTENYYCHLLLEVKIDGALNHLFACLMTITLTVFKNHTLNLFLLKNETFFYAVIKFKQFGMAFDTFELLQTTEQFRNKLATSKFIFDKH